jgi:hypothetical protein
MARVFEQILLGVSTRGYAGSLEASLSPGPLGGLRDENGSGSTRRKACGAQRSSVARARGVACNVPGGRARCVTELAPGRPRTPFMSSLRQRVTACS